jgi:hypothetical protein
MAIAGSTDSDRPGDADCHAATYPNDPGHADCHAHRAGDPERDPTGTDRHSPTDGPVLDRWRRDLPSGGLDAR